MGFRGYVLEWSVRWSGQYTGLRTERFWIPILDQEANFSSMPVQEVVFFTTSPFGRQPFYPHSDSGGNLSTSFRFRRQPFLPHSGSGGNLFYPFSGSGGNRSTPIRIPVVIFRQPPPGFWRFFWVRGECSSLDGVCTWRRSDCSGVMVVRLQRC